MNRACDGAKLTSRPGSDIGGNNQKLVRFLQNEGYGTNPLDTKKIGYTQRGD